MTDRSPRSGRPRQIATVVALAVASATGCAGQKKPRSVPLSSRIPLDIRVPQAQPEPEVMMTLPALWEGEIRRAAVKVEMETEKVDGNFDDLFGPIAVDQPRNPYLMVEINAGQPQLVERRPSKDGKKAMAEADKAYSDRKMDKAIAAYKKVIETDPLWPKPFFYIAAALKQGKNYESADNWIERGLRLWPKDAFGYALRAQMQDERGQPVRARETLARALALDPFSPPALALLTKLGAKDPPGAVPPVEIERSGNKLAVRAERAAWRQYGACRGLLVYDGRIRAEFLQGLAPGVQSPFEDTTCAALAVAVYRQSGATGTDADPILERWGKAYDAGLLREAAIFDGLAARRPEILLLLDHPSLRMFDYARLLVVPPAP